MKVIKLARKRSSGIKTFIIIIIIFFNNLSLFFSTHHRPTAPLHLQRPCHFNDFNRHLHYPHQYNHQYDTINMNPHLGHSPPPPLLPLLPVSCFHSRSYPRPLPPPPHTHPTKRMVCLPPITVKSQVESLSFIQDTSLMGRQWARSGLSPLKRIINLRRVIVLWFGAADRLIVRHRCRFLPWGNDGSMDRGRLETFICVRDSNKINTGHTR